MIGSFFQSKTGVSCLFQVFFFAFFIVYVPHINFKKWSTFYLFVYINKSTFVYCMIHLAATQQ